MTERSAVILELARNELLRSGEEAFGKLQRLRHAEAYQVLLDLAYR